MKIERSSVTITEIPYFDSIEVMPSGILLTRGASEQTLHVADIEAIRDALNEAIRLKREGMSGEPAPAGRAPRVWSSSSTEPGPEVTAVIDRDDDIWHFEDGQWRFADRYRSWGTLVRSYGPLTEVLP